MKAYQKFMQVIINDEIKWHMLSNANEVKQSIVNVVDKFNEEVQYGILDETDKEALNALNLYATEDGYIRTATNDILYITEYEQAKDFLTKYYPHAKWHMMTDIGAVPTWYRLFNLMEDIYGYLLPYITTKTEKENNLKLDLVF